MKSLTTIILMIAAAAYTMPKSDATPIAKVVPLVDEVEIVYEAPEAIVVALVDEVEIEYKNN
jgi:hypothetical protein